MITQRYTHQRNGFTLVEALVAITILLLVIIGPITIAQKGTQNAYYASEQLGAVFLAQEAIEAVRFARDSRALDVYDDVNSGQTVGDTADWALSLSNDCSSYLGCTYDAENGFNRTTCTQNGEMGCPVYYDPTSQMYTQDYGEHTPYYRVVRVEDVGSGAWRILSTVSWKNERVFGSAPRSVILETWMYDQYQWYENN